MQLCSKREYCCYDITEKLNQWEVDYDLHQQIIDKLIDNKFIDESRYTQAFVSDKFKFNNWGKIKIKHHLKQKQISDNLIYEHLNSINDSEYSDKISYEIKKKLKTVKAKDNFERNQKVARYVISKGFEPSIVFDLLNID